MIRTLAVEIDAGLNAVREVLQFVRHSCHRGRPVSHALIREQLRDALQLVDQLERDLVDVYGEVAWSPDDLVVLADTEGGD